MQGHPALERLEQDGRAEGAVVGVGAVPEDAGVLAQPGEDLRLALRRAFELLPPLDRGGAGDEVAANPSLVACDRGAERAVLLIAFALIEHIAELVPRDDPLGLARLEAQPAKRVADLGHHRSVDDASPSAGQAVHQGLADVVARDQPRRAAPAQPHLDRLVGYEDQGMDVWPHAPHRPVQHAAQDLGLVVGRGIGALDVPGGAALLGERPVPLVAREDAGVTLDLDQEQPVASQHQQVDLVQPSCPRVQQLVQRPNQMGIGVRQLVLDELDRLPFPRKVRLATPEDASLGQCHRFSPRVPRAARSRFRNTTRRWRSPPRPRR